MPQFPNWPHPPIHTLDLKFLNFPGAIAAYLIPHAQGAVLVESGPGSTTESLQASLRAHGLEPSDISDVFLSHIHLDHAGAAGWLARQGARIHVHPAGAPHLLDPQKLLSSAQRIYGEMMEPLWGDFLPVPKDHLSVLADQQVVEVGGLRVQALDTPGHARHHFAYLCGDTCFSGDIGGVRLEGPPHLVLPMPPPEFYLEEWRGSARRSQAAYDQGLFRRIAPTHFGIYADAGWHLAELGRALDEVEAWLLTVMPIDPPIEALSEGLISWAQSRYRRDGLSDEQIQIYETANPSWMSPHGLQRYWRKHRSPEAG
jgi:glyoxylase-like metal-dependent hydrolase (beta-lactamase superfamily II)